MTTICPQCDQEARPDATVGSPCGQCGMALISVAAMTDDLLGTVIDERFDVIERLGQGGMGTVYRARQRSIGRDVAIKLIDRRFETDVTVVKRFFREAQLASQLAHPNTVGVIDFGQHHDGRLYLAMELVRGRSLDRVLRAEGAFSIERVIRIGTQLCDALGAAHALSIIHRDLKLDNVMLLDGDSDLIKVLDFGLARSLVDPASRATATGIIAGTPRFMAPEVVLEAAEPAPAQDMYAIGVILAELASNRGMWNAATIPAMFAEKLRPDLTSVPDVLRPLVGRLVSPQPSDRPTARATRAALVGLGGRALALDDATEIDVVAPSLIPLELVPLAQPWPTYEPPNQPASLVAPAEPAPRPSSAFAANAPQQEPKLELEAGWQRAPVVVATPAAVRRGGGGSGGVIAALVVVAAIGAVVFVLSRKADPPALPPLPHTANTVSIEVKSSPNAMVRLDDQKAGMTPLTLHLGAAGHKRVVISATVDGVLVRREIVADHDQVVDLSAPADSR